MGVPSHHGHGPMRGRCGSLPNGLDVRANEDFLEGGRASIISLCWLRCLLSTYHGEEEDGWKHLKAPWETECSDAIDEGGTVGDIEHDQNTPGDSPLLSTDDTTTFTWWCQFGDVDRNLSGANTDSPTVDESSNNEHSDVLRGADQN